MSRVEVPMPQMGESIAEGTVSVWLKKVGDRVERDEPIMEISTDKVDAEIPSPAAGVLAEIVVDEGETVEVGTIVAYVETGAGAAAEPAATLTEPGAVSREKAAAPEESAAVASEPVTASSPVPAPEPGTPEEEPATPIRGEARSKAQRDSASGASAEPERVGEGDGRPETAEERLRRRSTPLVRRIAAEHGVAIEEVSGTGRAGRVTKEDVLRFVEEQERVTAGGRPVRRRDESPAPGDFSWDAFYSHVQHPEVEVGPRDRVERMSRMTSLIAEHMILSKRISAHVHSYFEIDYSRIDQVRARNRRSWEEQGVKVTYTAFVARAVAQALRDHPKLNASISGENVIYRGEVNLGVAVALDWGLIVPVVRNADDLSLVGLARAIGDVADRARRKKLAPQEVQGGTFTITNPGIFGTVIGFPIVNQPQVAIMGVGAVEKRPVVIADEFGHEAIVARKRGFLALGYDHRLVNGADADRFLARVKEILETFHEAA